jgi:hypothetical protein
MFSSTLNSPSATDNSGTTGSLLPFDFTIPHIAQHGEKGLGDIPKDVLERCLQPVMRGLQNMDAQALLELKQVPPHEGARLRQG